MTKFSIVTPSYNILSYLKCCHASIKDQTDINFEHIIIDGGSKDGTVEWLKEQKDIVWISEKDNGMYDAINKGLLKAKGEILAYLNCDEQYLPGTLNYVYEFFSKNPNVDVVFGDTLIISPSGELLSYRKGYRPRYSYIISAHLYLLSCTMFFRKKIIEDGYFFDNKLRDAGDADFVLRLLKNKYKAVHLKRYFSTFTYTGNNMSKGANATKERSELFNSSEIWIRTMKLPLNGLRFLEKILSGAYFEKKPIQYDIYLREELSKRTKFSANKASFKWPK